MPKPIPWSERAKQLYTSGSISLAQLEVMQSEAAEHGDPNWHGNDGLPPWRISYGGVWRDAGLLPVRGR